MKDYIEENINEKEFINKLEYFIKNIDNEIDENFANMISPYHFSELKENKISKREFIEYINKWHNEIKKRIIKKLTSLFFDFENI